MRIKRSGMLVAAMALVAGLIPSGAQAQDATVCVIAGDVNLNEDVFFTSASDGTGEFSTLAGITCQGTISGTAGFQTPSSFNFSLLAGPIAEVGGSVSTTAGLTQFGVGAVTCSITFGGVATVPAAALLVDMSCETSFVSIAAAAEATFVPIPSPAAGGELGGEQCDDPNEEDPNCFRSVKFVGLIEAAGV
ncbi:MAG TPA: hypothetical protein VGB83_06400 [Actinomycetota bacterium]